MARALIALAALAAMSAWAQPMADPTRPSGIPSATAGSADGTPQASLLQSVMLRRGMKPKALLGGEWVELGQEYNGARVIKITESSVSLKGASGVEVMQLAPDVTLTPVKPPAAQAGKKRSSRNAGPKAIKLEPAKSGDRSGDKGEVR